MKDHQEVMPEIRKYGEEWVRGHLQSSIMKLIKYRILLSIRDNAFPHMEGNETCQLKKRYISSFSDHSFEFEWSPRPSTGVSFPPASYSHAPFSRQPNCFPLHFFPCNKSPHSINPCQYSFPLSYYPNLFGFILCLLVWIP